MISKDEAYKLALEYTRHSNQVSIHLTDFDTVCVVEFTHKTKPHELPDPLLDDEDDLVQLDPGFDIPFGGYSPILIDKRDSSIHETGSDVLYPPDCYADCYLSSGSPRGKPTATVTVSNLGDDFNLDELTAVLINHSQMSNAEAKRKLRQKGDFEVIAKSTDAATDLAKELRTAGVEAIQHWIGDGIPQYADAVLIDDTTIEIDLGIDDQTEDLK